MRKTLTLLAFAAVIGIAAPSWAQCPTGGCRYSTAGRTSYRFYQGTTIYAQSRAQVVAPCAPTVVVAPCAPVDAPITEPCAPCASVETVEPCAPVVAPCETCETTGEYVPLPTVSGEIALDPCAGGACPIRKTTQAATTVVSKTARGAVNVVAGALDRLNATRARYGLTALKLDATLETGAQAQAGICSTSGTLRHGAGVAEILAQNSQGIETAVTQWLNSPAHRALLLNSGFKYAGVGIIKDNYGRVWCAVRFR